MLLYVARFRSLSRFLMAAGLLCCLCSVAHTQEADGTPRFRAVALRLGGNFSPNAGLAAGLDYTVRLKPGFATRFTIEGIFSARQGSELYGHSPISLFTIDQMYQQPGAGRKPYIGLGFGIYHGPLGRQTTSPIEVGPVDPYYVDEAKFGGKVFVGGDFTSTTGLEGAVHFMRDTTLATLQLRLKL